MSYETHDRDITILWANMNRFPYGELPMSLIGYKYSKEEYDNIVNKTKDRIDIKLLEKLDTENLIDK